MKKPIRQISSRNISALCARNCWALTASPREFHYLIHHYSEIKYLTNEDIIEMAEYILDRTPNCEDDANSIIRKIVATCITK